jgi:hypothetical protein
VTDAAGNPVADGTSVTFVVTGSHPASYTTTTTNGQARVTYSGSLTGIDTLTATATGGTTPSASATITWTAPSSTPHATLTIIDPLSPSIVALVQTGRTGGPPVGRFSYTSRSVTLSQVHLTSLVVTRSTATLYGQAQLADGTTVDFRFEVTASRLFGTARLRLSTGYDSGPFTVRAVRITP